MSAHSRSLLTHLHRLAAPAAPDAMLLSRWTQQRDQHAFAALMARHGPMVLGVCRRILGDVQEAEDVFQATFLVLARQTSPLRQPESLAGFLHTVSRRLARKARAAMRRRQRMQTNAQTPEPIDPQPPALDVLSGRELLALVDEEIARLPEVYRLPVLLCLMQGRTIEEAARQLGWSIGSLRGRLTRGRERLRERLSQRGLDLSVGAVALLAPAAVPEKLLADGVRGLSGTVPAAIDALAGGMMPALKLKIAGLAVVVAAAVGMAAGLSMLRAPREEIPAVDSPAAPPARVKDEPRRDRDGDPLPEGAVARLGTRRFRIDTEHVHELAFAPDGKTIAAASDGGLWIFDAATGKLRKIIRPHATLFSRIAFSPDSKRLLSAAAQDRRIIREKSGFRIAEKSVVQIWDVAGGQKTVEVELEGISCLGWTAEGLPLAVSRREGEINLHELATGRKRRFAEKKGADAIAGPCALGKNILAASDEAGDAHVWDITSGKERWVFKTGGHRSFSNGLRLSADGRWLASLSLDAANKHVVQLWNLTTGKATRLVAADQPSPQAIVFTPDGQTLATIDTSKILFWDMASGRERGRLKEDRAFSINAFAFSPDGKTLAIPEELSGTIHLWDEATGERKPEADGHSTNWVQAASFSPDGKRVATSGGMDGSIRVWDAASGRQLAQYRRPWPNGSTACAFSTDGRKLFSCWNDKLLVADAATGRELHDLKCANMMMYVSSDRRKAIALRDASTSQGYSGGGGFAHDWRITGWDTTTRKPLFRRQLAFQGSQWDIAVSPDAKVFALASAKREPMRLEDVETGEQLLTFPILKGERSPLCFSRDRRLLLSHTSTPAPPPAPGGFTRTLRLWEVLTASELLDLPISIDLLAKAAVSPDGRLLAAIAPQGEILLWDLRRGKELHRFKDFGSSTTSLAFTPDGRRLVSGLYDSTLLIWDVAAVRSNDRPTALDAASLRSAWDDLAGDARKGFAARWTLASAPAEAMALLKERLHPAKAADPQRLRRMLSDLESEQFTVREEAQKELTDLGDLAEPKLRQTLANKPTLEVRRRVQALLERMRGPVTQPELLRSLRAVAVLEDIDTPEARRRLEELAKGTPESRLTREAKESLRRLDLRRSPGR